MQNVVILGSTGSIGQSALAVIKHYPTSYSIFALVAGSNVDKMVDQCIEFQPKFAAMSDGSASRQLRQKLLDQQIKVEVISPSELNNLSAHPDVHIVIAAILGTAGLMPTLAAIRQGKRILLANKEALVTCGRIFMQAVESYNAQLLPIDSEHNAIFQSLPSQLQQQMGKASLSEHHITSILLTGSGGAFRDWNIPDLQYVTPEQACVHPNWSMGKKISVDSATMMNKGLEYIEARWLFNANEKEMEIIIHPQSIIHSMVRYQDGSIIAQMGTPDMRTPIAHALAYPRRIESGVKPLDFFACPSLTFYKPDFNRYPCLKLAIEAFRQGQAATTALNAANEVAVQLFLERRISFVEIADVSRFVLDKIAVKEPDNIDDVLMIDLWARKTAVDFC